MPPRKRSKVDADETKQKQKSNSKARKGITSSSQTDAVKETPGDPKYPKTFINIESNEQKVGAYLGFNDVADLRKLALSWPVLKATINFEGIAQNMNKTTAFRQINDNENLLRDTNYLQQWPLKESDSEEQKRIKKGRHLACILLEMEKDFGRMETDTQENNRQTQRAYILAMRNRFPAAGSLAEVDFLGEPSGVIREVKLPMLGPYKTESRIEPLNRCWSVLRYFRYCRQAGLWSRFTLARVSQSRIIDAAHIPAWMRPPEKVFERPEAIAKISAVTAADLLTPKNYDIVWDRSTKFDGLEELDKALQEAKAGGNNIPSAHQKLSEDPRLSVSAASFRDSIRRQFDCQRLLINIRSLELEYTNRTLSQNRLNRDILRDDWSDTQSTFANDANSDFVVHVQFEALDDPEENIFESTEPPPSIAAYFNTASGQVLVNADGVSEIAAAAFDSNGKQ